jgi:hypothetical protein
MRLREGWDNEVKGELGILIPKGLRFSHMQSSMKLIPG